MKWLQLTENLARSRNEVKTKNSRQPEVFKFFEKLLVDGKTQELRKNMVLLVSPLTNMLLSK